MFRGGRRSWGVGGASSFASRSFSHVSYVVCVSKPGRNRMCNGSVLSKTGLELIGSGSRTL